MHMVQQISWDNRKADHHTAQGCYCAAQLVPASQVPASPQNLPAWNLFLTCARIPYRDALKISEFYHSCSVASAPPRIAELFEDIFILLSLSPTPRRAKPAVQTGAL